MFASQYPNPLYAPGAPLNPGPGVPDGGSSTINLTDPARYGMRPSIYGGGATAFAGQPTSAAPPPGAGGMFGGGGKPNIAGLIAAALNGYLAAMPGPSQAVGLAGLKAQADRRQMQLEEQVYEHRQDLQMQRELSMLPIQARIKLMYPDNDAAQTAYQAGIMPGTPEWTHYMSQIAGNKADPPVVTPQGMMLTSTVRGMVQPPSAPVGGLSDYNPGGQTPPASGGFLGAPYAPIDGYPRY